MRGKSQRQLWRLPPEAWDIDIALQRFYVSGGDIPFVFQGSNSDVQVINVGE